MESVAPVGLIPPTLIERITSYHEAGPAWLETLPELIGRCAKQWELTLLPAFEPGGDSSWVAPVVRFDGSPAVLQITLPNDSRFDHVPALRAWDGCGAVRLFAYDKEIQATLMEHCVPGTHAADLTPDEQEAVAEEVLPQLWKAEIPPEAVPLSDLTSKFAEALRHRAKQFAGEIDTSPFLPAADLFETLGEDRSALVHGDFHVRNVVLSQRGWLAIDPMCLAGDPALDLADFVKSDTVDPARVEALARRLGLDPRRVLSWLHVKLTLAASWHFSVRRKAAYESFTRAAARILISRG